MSDQLIDNRKKDLRTKIADRLRQMTQVERETGSARVCEMIMLQRWYHDAGTVGAYLPLRCEVNVMPLLKRMLAVGKHVYVPYRREEDSCYSWTRYNGELEQGPDGVLQPVKEIPPENDTLDAVLVPGIAFDESGMRLGRGRGFYDRLLANSSCLKIGVAFDEQLVEAIASAEHDVRMDAVVTPMELFYVTKKTMNKQDKESGRK